MLLPFTCSNPDLTVRSIPDGTTFYAQRSALARSEIFRDMFFCCTQQLNDTSDGQILELHEPTQTLSALLNILHYSLKPPAELGYESSAGSDANVPIKRRTASRNKGPDAIDHNGISEAEGSSDKGSATGNSSSSSASIRTSSSTRDRFLPRMPNYNPRTVIPLPVLQSTLFDLVDKYALGIYVFRVLCVHLLAHVTMDPLKVYGFAASFEPRSRPSRVAGVSTREERIDGATETEMEREMEDVACKASEFLKPIGSYSMEEVLDAIPSVKALHRIAQLQHLRVKALRETLNGAEIFPKGYGACPSHREITMDCWNRQRRAVAGKIDSDTDVAGEMQVYVDTLKHCNVCYKAGVAAVEMLAYMCWRVPRKIHHLP